VGQLDPKTEQALRAVLEVPGYGIVTAYLFGSFARGTARPDSDIDIAVLYANAPEPTLNGQPFHLEGELERVAERAVQVINLHSAPIDLVHRVLQDGKLLVDINRALRIAFEVRARNEYFDMEPALRQYRGHHRKEMTDIDLIDKKLGQIETYVKELHTLARPAEILHDVRERRFAEHTLQIAIQAALDIASLMVSDDRLGEPSSNRALFELLEQHGWIDGMLAMTLKNMVGFRNLVVHGYAAVDPRLVKDVVENHVDDLLLFVAAIRQKVNTLR
jgi:uncharacterized protein YutE (UPF0331/DUF86 family)/predicted nucleotidyltransferase